MGGKITKMIAVTVILLLSVSTVFSQIELTVFHETFDNLTTANTTGNALVGGNTDETGYVVGGGGSAMSCTENGTMNLTGGRFATKNLDLSGNNIKLYVRYKLATATTKKFQIDIDKTGTSGMGGILNEAGGSSPTSFETKVFNISSGTADSYIHFRTESSHTIILDEIKITQELASLTANISLTSGENPASAMETMEMTPVVYTYINVTEPSNVVANWYTDASYTTTTTAPAGLAVSQDTENGTMTLGGTPSSGTAGTYYYKIVVNESDGNAVEGSVVVSAYVTPAPVIELTDGDNPLSVKSGSAIVAIVYTLTNADGASVSGLPAGLSGTYESGSFTISGAVDGSVTPGTFEYTVTADALSGYAGDNVVANGTIYVKSADAVDILYLIGGSAVASSDMVYTYMEADTGYFLVAVTAAASAPAASAYDPYDLIVVHEGVAGSNAELVALKNIDKPILNFKSFSYNTGRWEWGTADNGSDTNLSVTVKQPSHPVFAGIPEAAIDAALDLIGSVVSSKGIQPADVTLAGSINVATAPKASGDAGVAIHDVPGAIRGVGSKYLMIPVFADSYQNITGVAKEMIDNAVDYLLNGVQFTAPDLAVSSFSSGGYSAVINEEELTIRLNLPMGTALDNLTPDVTLAGVGVAVSPAGAQDFSNSADSPLSYVVSDLINTKTYAVTIVDQLTVDADQSIARDFSFDGRVIRNTNHGELTVFDLSGRALVSSTDDISLAEFNNGVYVVRGRKAVLKIVLLK